MAEKAVSVSPVLRSPNRRGPMQPINQATFGAA